MRRLSWLLLVMVGCGRSDADPIAVAERFHAFRLAGDDHGIHALLSETDRAAVPLEAFPAALPPGVELELFGWGETRVDSASLLSAGRDTAAVLLHMWPGDPDTLRLVALREARRLWRFQLDRVRWRVSLGLVERARLDSLAASVRARGDATDSAAVAGAEAYLAAMERAPHLARPADVDAARGTIRKAAIARALRVELRAADSFTGTRFLGGEVENPTRTRIGTLRLMARDATGAEERVELWDIGPGETAAVWQLTRLRKGTPTYRVERIQLY